MKKSNKLLVVLFLFITVSLVFFNVLLNAQLKKGNFKSEYNDVHKVTIALKPFRHVVYEGRMDIEKTKFSSSWVERSIQISTGEGFSHSLEMPSDTKQILDYRYQSDTLFIRFERKDKQGRQGFIPESSDMPLRLLAPGISSISSSYGTTNISGVHQQEPMALYLKKCRNVTLRDVHVPVLQVNADSISAVNVIENSHLDTMVLSMSVASTITFNTPIQVKTILQRKIDSSVRISVTGSSADMKEFLQKSQ